MDTERCRRPNAHTPFLPTNMPSEIIKLNELNARIREVIQSFGDAHLSSKTHPLINGIVIDETNLAKAEKLADQIKAKFAAEVPAGMRLESVAKQLGHGQILVGFKAERV